jgi:NitT/TauT family transport system substrate-binding protein
MKKWLTAGFLILVLAGTLLFSGCSKTEEESAVKVTLNEVAHSIFYAPQYVAIEEGYFAEEGLDLELVNGYGADKTMTAVLSGEADIGFMGRKHLSTLIWKAQKIPSSISHSLPSGPAIFLCPGNL